MHDALEELRKRYPFPSERPKKTPFYWCLESGGKQLVKDAIIKHDVRLMVEIGVFFGGSVLQWLKTSPSLTVIGIDPWWTNWASYFDKNAHIYSKNIDFGGLNEAEFRDQLDSESATFECVLSNLWDYRDRFIPMRGITPAALLELIEIGVKPGLVYIDSDKRARDLDIIHEKLPGCIICGDDWTWKPEEDFPIRKEVIPFAEKNDYEIITSYGTWLLAPKQ